jgi:hypothetical protein
VRTEFHADAAAHPVGPPGPVQAPPLVRAEGGLVYEEAGSDE